MKTNRRAFLGALAALGLVKVPRPLPDTLRGATFAEYEAAGAVFDTFPEPIRDVQTLRGRLYVFTDQGVYQWDPPALLREDHRPEGDPYED